MGESETGSSPSPSKKKADFDGPGKMAAKELLSKEEQEFQKQEP